MDIKELKSKKLYKEYLLKIPYLEVDKLINNKINEIIPTVTLPGFRKGKAPINIVKKKYESGVLSEVIEKLVQEQTKKLLDEKNIKPLRAPRIDIKKYEKDSPIEIEIKVDEEPKIKLENFKNFSLNKYEIDIEQNEINKNYNNFLNLQKTYKKINSNREIKETDKVYLNIITENKLVPDFLKSQKNIPIITDSDYQILPDLSKKLIEKKVKQGDKVNLLFDLKEVLKKESKTEISFSIEIISIEESSNLEINQEFFKKMGVKDEKELKENFKKNLILQ